LKDSKEHILEVSLNLFLQKNFKEVTMQEIVDKTGLSKGAFYHYFKSKEQVFEDVINHYYTDYIISDYSVFSQSSLVQFYTDVLLERRRKVTTSKIMDTNEDKVFTSNHYFLMFDAMKLLPDFKRQRIQQQKDELKAWIKVIGVAKRSKEINSKMDDDKVAKLFILSGKGVGINCIMEDNPDPTKEIKALWDGLYNELKK